MDKINLQTPYFIVNTEGLEKHISELKQSLFKYWSNGIIGYSFKTNNLPWVISYMKEKGLYAEVVSSDEYQLAKKLEYPLEKIIFNGPAKRKLEFIEAVENNSIVNIDSKRELQWLLECSKDKLKNSTIGLRVNFCLEEYCPGESQCGEEDGRFGFSYENGELKNAIYFLRKNKIPLSGLHLHCSSKTRSLNIYKAIAKVAVKIVNEYSLQLKYIDIGGGFFGGMPDKPSFNDYFYSVFKIFENEELLKSVNIIVEPGMCLIGANMDYVTSVIDVKETKNNSFVVLDGSRIHIDPLMTKKNYFYQIHRNKRTTLKSDKKNQILCGFTCMEKDRFFNLLIEPLEINDQIIFEKVGAYTIGMAPQFIEFHPDIYILSDNKMKLIQNKRTVSEFIIATNQNKK